MVYHKKTINNAWHKMSLAEQMANIGSEYFRTQSWKQKNNDKYFWPAFERMLELIESSLVDKRWPYYRLKEFARLKEMLCEYFLEDGINKLDSNFDKYFMSYSLLARKDK